MEVRADGVRIEPEFFRKLSCVQVEAVLSVAYIENNTAVTGLLRKSGDASLLQIQKVVVLSVESMCYYVPFVHQIGNLLDPWRHMPYMNEQGKSDCPGKFLSCFYGCYPELSDTGVAGSRLDRNYYVLILLICIDACLQVVFGRVVSLRRILESVGSVMHRGEYPGAGLFDALLPEEIHRGRSSRSRIDNGSHALRDAYHICGKSETVPAQKSFHIKHMRMDIDKAGRYVFTCEFDHLHVFGTY